MGKCEVEVPQSLVTYFCVYTCLCTRDPAIYHTAVMPDTNFVLRYLYMHVSIH